MAQKIATGKKQQDNIEPTVEPKAQCSVHEERQQKKRIRKRVWFSVAGGLIVLYFVFGYTARFIFGRDAWITQIAERGIADVINIVRFFENSLSAVFNSLSILFVGIVIIWLSTILVRLFGKGNNRRKTVFGLIASFIKYIGAIVILMSLLGLGV